MTTNAKEFIKKIFSDEALRTELELKLRSVSVEEQNDVMIEYAKTKGFELSVADFGTNNDEFSPEELEAVCGGGFCMCALAGESTGEQLRAKCYGFGFGGGYGFCICALYGIGGGK